MRKEIVWMKKRNQKPLRLRESLNFGNEAKNSE